jgi:phospholipase/carboxylesterase
MDDLILQQAAAPQQLILLFHGVGAGPEHMAPLGHALAGAFPEAMVVAVAGPYPSDFSSGRQWFSVREVSEDSRVERVAAALPVFAEQIRAWQQRTGATAEQTALIGFSQGAIMTLEACVQLPGQAGRAISIAGRFACLPEQISDATTIHLIHGKEDGVIPYEHTVRGAYRLKALGADFTAEVLPFVQHEINEDVIALVIRLLQNHVPQRVWQQAMRAAPEDPPDRAGVPVQKRSE